jgi:hypothetical protein
MKRHVDDGNVETTQKKGEISFQQIGEYNQPCIPVIFPIALQASFAFCASGS